MDNHQEVAGKLIMEQSVARTISIQNENEALLQAARTTLKQCNKSSNPYATQYKRFVLEQQAPECAEQRLPIRSIELRGTMQSNRHIRSEIAYTTIL